MIFTGSYKLIKTLKQLGWDNTQLISASEHKSKQIEFYLAPLAPAQNLVVIWRRFKDSAANRGLVWKQIETAYKRQLMRYDVKEFAELLDGKIILTPEPDDTFSHRRFIRDWFNHYGYTAIELTEHEED